MPAQTMWRLELLNADQTDGFWHAIESQVRVLQLGKFYNKAHMLEV